MNTDSTGKIPPEQSWRDLLVVPPAIPTIDVHLTHRPTPQLPVKDLHTPYRNRAARSRPKPDAWRLTDAFHTNVPLTPFFPIAEEIENAIIIPLAEEFRASNWSIAAVLRRLFMSQHFYDAGLMGAYIKSPVDLFVGTARALLAGPLEGECWEHPLQAIHMMSTQTGQWLFVPPGVQGWQFHRTWISGTTLPLRRAHTDKLIDGWTSITTPGRSRSRPGS